MPRKSFSSSASGHSPSPATVNRASFPEDHDHLLLTAIVRASEDAILSKTLEGIITTWNPAAERMFGYMAEEIIGQPKTILFPPDRLEEEAIILDRLKRGLATNHFDTVRLHKDGTRLHVSVTISPIKDADGHVVGASTIARDISARKQAEQQQQESARRLQASEERYALALEGSQSGIWDWDLSTGEFHFSARWEQMIGYAPGEFPTRFEDWNTHLHPDDCLRVQATLAAYLNRETDVYETEFRLRHKNGSYRWILARGIARFDSAGQPYRMAGSHMDISQQKCLTEQLQTANEWLEDAIEQLILQQTQLQAANTRLEALATTDGLTGVKNHRALQDRLHAEYARAVRYNTPLSVLMLDVDEFKQYNDAFGHPMGDIVLRQLAQLLCQSTRGSDVVARYGGEEFACLLPETDAEEAKIMAERLRHAIETAGWPQRTVTVSIGAATWTHETVDANALLADADTALYRSKHWGRNCVTHAIDMVQANPPDPGSPQRYDGLSQTLQTAQAEALVAAENQTHETLQQAYETTIKSWSHLLDCKDKASDGHGERVTEMLVRLGRQLNLDEHEIQFARWGAWLHDIGKIAVPDHILQKPGPLTAEEWDVIRQHPTIAYEMLEPVEFLGSTIDIPYCHHEKWDGTGYPRGLKADEIPLMARLFAVIDVYDALTSDRPYRQAWPEAQVRAYLREQAGAHFDPRVVEAFLALCEQPTAPRAAQRAA